jgi:hypothetical protein
MVLTDTDAENADHIEKVANARSKAHSVGIALSLARYIVDAFGDGAQLYLEYPNGAKEKVVVPDFAGIGRRRTA